MRLSAASREKTQECSGAAGKDDFMGKERFAPNLKFNIRKPDLMSTVQG
jgi:hypothetical protein